eukprot:108152-Rhodomonas_salina.2
MMLPVSSVGTRRKRAVPTYQIALRQFKKAKTLLANHRYRATRGRMMLRTHWSTASVPGSLSNYEYRSTEVRRLTDMSVPGIAYGARRKIGAYTGFGAATG